MTSIFRMLAAYNVWANQRLYDAVAQLTDEQFRADRGAFFRSVRGTLNHILVADRIWMRRFTGEGDAPDRLDTILFDGLADLTSARTAEDSRIVAHVTMLDDAALAGAVSYRRISSPDAIDQIRAPLLLHVFNHQTHHRGQVHCILTGFGAAAPALDLAHFQRESEAGTST